MPRIRLYFTHLFTSFSVLAIFAGVYFLGKEDIAFAWKNAPRFFGDSLSVEEAQFSIFSILLVALGVLLVYVFYLILAYKTRASLEVWEATKTLAFDKEEFRWLYDNAPVPYMLLDKEALISDPNKASLRFFEVLPEEIEGKNIFSFASPENIDEGKRLFQHYTSRVGVNRQELEMVTKSGAKHIVLISIYEMNHPRGGSVGLVMLFDITEQKLLDKQKTEFVSLASHQLRTPLATTKWYVEMLLSADIENLSEKQKEYLGKLDAANKNMIELVDVLLNVSRLEMGTLAIDSKSTDVESLTESILAELSVDITRKGLSVDKHFGEFLRNVQSDPKLLRIVIQNLVSNAVKYTPDGGKITIEFEDGRKGKKIIVSDTGVGIPKEAKDKIFSKLFRADNVRNLEHVQGTGLGLYLVKSLIVSMGGDISFVSEENKGSIFTITLEPISK